MKSLLFLSLGVSLAAAEPVAKQWKAPDGTEVLYRHAAPATVEEGKLYPLVVFLHGSGERGTDNTSQLKHGVRDILANAEKLAEPIHLIAPQCPPGRWWSEPTEGWLQLADAGGENPLMAAILALVVEMTGTQQVDPDRIYLTGLSMGGFGTWDLLSRAPDQFAAAIAVCGGGDPSLAATFKHVPIRIFHGDADTVVKPQASLLMQEALEKAKADSKLTIYPGVGHDSWTATYRDGELFKWLFSKKK